MKHMLKHTVRGRRLASLAASLSLCVCLLFSATGAGAAVSGTPVYSAEELFTGRDLEQSPDLTGAVYLSVSDGETLRITEAGAYVLSGSASGATVTVDAPDDAKVQLVLDGVQIANTDFPCIYVKNADKLFLTVAADSSLSVSGSFRQDGGTNTDGVIFSLCDLTLNGTAALTIRSSDNGIVGKDDLKLTGGSYDIRAASKCIEANDSIRISGGTLTLQAGTDGLHAEHDSDGTLGYIYIGGGSLSVTAGDDGIHGTSVVQIDGGSLEISAGEGIEATYVQINGGTISISARDDGINAGRKSAAYAAKVEINGGEIRISMAQGDTDGVDANGDIVINGGWISVSGTSTFDCDGSGVINGGTVICNGQQVSALPNQMMGGGRGGQGGWPSGGQNGDPGGWFGGGRRR